MRDITGAGDSLVACACAGANRVEACDEIVCRLLAAERSEAEGHREVADELRRMAERFSVIHLAELDGCPS